MKKLDRKKLHKFLQGFVLEDRPMQKELNMTLMVNYKIGDLLIKKLVIELTKIINWR